MDRVVQIPKMEALGWAPIKKQTQVTSNSTFKNLIIYTNVNTVYDDCLIENILNKLTPHKKYNYFNAKKKKRDINDCE